MRLIGRSIPLTTRAQVWQPAIEQIFTGLENLVGDKELACKLTKQDMELIQACGNPDPQKKLDPSGKRGVLYVNSVKQAFFPKIAAGKVGKVNVDANWFKTPEERQQ